MVTPSRGTLTVTALNAALFTLMHGDRPSILAVLPFYDWYQGLVLNYGWIIAIGDEIRGTKMRWCVVRRSRWAISTLKPFRFLTTRRPHQSGDVPH
jgi:hypothetical protein